MCIKFLQSDKVSNLDRDKKLLQFPCEISLDLFRSCNVATKIQNWSKPIDIDLVRRMEKVNIKIKFVFFNLQLTILGDMMNLQTVKITRGCLSKRSINYLS